VTVAAEAPVLAGGRSRRTVMPILCWGALAVATLESIDAVVAWGIVRGTRPLAIFQGVAGGFLGRAAFQGGWPTAILGGVLHYFISLAIVAVYYFAARRVPALARHAVTFGLLYGAGVFLVMNHVVVPLSALGGGNTDFFSPLYLNGILGHPLVVGLPAAFAARAALARREATR
jgi:hypothetical protein